MPTPLLVLSTVAALLSLAGSEWGPETEDRPEIYIQFKETSVNGHGGCNRFFGQYSFDGNAISIGPLASTKMACSKEVMEAELAWMDMLQRARSAEASFKTLVLRDEAGTVIATLRHRDWD